MTLITGFVQMKFIDIQIYRDLISAYHIKHHGYQNKF